MAFDFILSAVGEAGRALQEAERMERMSEPSGGAAQAVRHSNR